MRCIKCGSETRENEWGDWCDQCGGVIVAGTPPKLFFRHVATVEGARGRFPIVYDLSASAYGVAWPKEVTMVKCRHCGQQTPGDDGRDGLTRLDDLRVAYHSRRGALDTMLAFIQPIARGNSEELPSLSVAPTATEGEGQQVLG